MTYPTRYGSHRFAAWSSDRSRTRDVDYKSLIEERIANVLRRMVRDPDSVELHNELASLRSQLARERGHSRGVCWRLVSPIDEFPI